jgi:hypothetical protein
MAKVVLDPPLAMKTNTYYIGDSYNFISNSIYRYSIPMSFVFLNTWNISATNTKFLIKTIVGGLDDNTTLSRVFYRATSATKIFLIGMDIIVMCSDDANCLTWTYYPLTIGTSSQARSDWKGMGVSLNLSYPRTDNFNIGFSTYFAKPPKYYAVAINKMTITNNFKNFSIKINSAQRNSIDFNLTLPSYSFIDLAFWIILASDTGKKNDSN